MNGILFETDGTLNNVTKALLNEDGKVQVEKLYVESASYSCVSVVAEIELSDDNKVAILKEYGEEKPVYYLTDDYRLKDNTIELRSKSDIIDTLEEAEKALIDYSLQNYNSVTTEYEFTNKIQSPLSNEYYKWFAGSGSYRPLHEQLISYFDEDKLINLIKNSSCSNKSLEYMDEYLSTNSFYGDINKFDVVQDIEGLILTSQSSHDEIQSIEVLDSNKKGCFDVVAKYELGRQCLMTKPNKELADKLADIISKKYDIPRYSEQQTPLIVQNYKKSNYKR